MNITTELQAHRFIHTHTGHRHIQTVRETGSEKERERDKNIHTNKQNMDTVLGTATGPLYKLECKLYREMV